MQRQSNHAFSLSIAGLTLTVHCNDASLATTLRQRYHAFPAVGLAQLEAYVELAGQRRSLPYLDTGTVFRDGMLHFTAPGYEGFIDEMSGTARLELSSAQPEEDVDYFVRVAYALLAFQAGGLLFHAAGVVRAGRAYLFFGHSGSGKTTVARLSANVSVLNDDLVLLMPEGGGWVAHATPFWNPSQVAPAGRHSALVTALFRLVQDRSVYLEKIGQGQAIAEIVSNVPVIPVDPERSVALLERCRHLLKTIPLRRLHFLLDDTFWNVVERIE